MKLTNISIGLRTWKTVVSVVLALLIVNTYGTTTSRLTFAMLGAMTAMQPTFIESLESVLTQIIGVFFGAVVGVLLLMLPIPYIAATGIGIVLRILDIESDNAFAHFIVDGILETLSSSIQSNMFYQLADTDGIGSIGGRFFHGVFTTATCTETQSHCASNQTGK